MSAAYHLNIDGWMIFWKIVFKINNNNNNKSQEFNILVIENSNGYKYGQKEYRTEHRKLFYVSHISLLNSKLSPNMFEVSY